MADWDQLPAFMFEVSFTGPRSIDDVAFQEVSGLESSIEVETVVEGGVNDFVHRLPKPVKQGNLKLKRGLEKTDGGLADWCKDTLEGGFANLIQPMDLTIKLLDREGSPVREWDITNAYPIKWDIGSLDAMKSELVIETIELSYNTLRG